MKLKNKLKSSLMMALAALSFFTSAANAIMLDIESGTNVLLGIDDINIQGTLWDVDFIDSIWHEIDGDFATNSDPVYASAFALTEAQLDLGHAEIKKFLDSSAATVGRINYGNSPASINGCSFRNCRVQTPYALDLSGTAPKYYEKSFVVLRSQDIFLTSGSTSVSNDFGGSVIFTYGVWSQAPVSAVPEPASYAMLLAGLGLLGLAKRRQQA